MEEKQRYFRLGLFVIVALAILFGILFLLGGRSLFQPTLVFETYFNQSVAGLELGSPVKFRGIPLGQVVSIESSSLLYERDVPIQKRKGYIVVRGKVTGSRERVEEWKRDVPKSVTLGLRAQTQLAGITGQQYLALDTLDPKTNPTLEFSWTPEHLYIPSAPSLTGQIIAGIQKFLASLNEADIKSLGQNLNRLVENVNTKLDQLDVAQVSSEAVGLLKDSRAAIKRLNLAIAGISSAADRLNRLLGEPGITQTVDNSAAITARLRTLAESGELDRLVKNLDETIRRANAILGENQYDVRVIIQDLRTTADNLRTLSETAKRYPAGLLIGGPPKKIELQGKESK